MQDRHHILHDRQEWSLRPEGKQLREEASLIPMMDREAHKELHRNCPSVPLLGRFALYRVARDFEPQDNHFDSIDNLLFSIEEAGNHRKAHPLEKSLGELAVHAIDLQRPYIKEGLASTSKVIY